MPIWNKNSRSRTPLDSNDIRTIKFKIIFPDYKIWKDNLVSYGILDADINEPFFNFLEELVGNSYLMYPTATKNKSLIAMQYRKYLYIFKKQKALADKNIDDLMNVGSSNESTLYTINRTNQNVVLADYIDNKVKTTNNTKIAIIDRLKEILDFNSFNDPELVMLSNLANSIVYPIQADQYGRMY